VSPTISYSGTDPGVQSAYIQYSHVHPNITAPDFPHVLMDYSEVEFYLAEAAQRGYDVGGSASEHYANGVTASILYWGGTPQKQQRTLPNRALHIRPQLLNNRSVFSNGSHFTIVAWMRGFRGEDWTVLNCNLPTMLCQIFQKDFHTPSMNRM